MALRDPHVACAACGLPDPEGIAAIPDPVARSRAATEAITAVQAHVTRLAQVRRTAVGELRDARGMTQREVAAALGISQARVAQIEHGTV